MTMVEHVLKHYRFRRERCEAAEHLLYILEHYLEYSKTNALYSTVL